LQPSAESIREEVHEEHAMHLVAGIFSYIVFCLWRWRLLWSRLGGSLYCFHSYLLLLLSLPINSISSSSHSLTLSSLSPLLSSPLLPLIYV